MRGVGEGPSFLPGEGDAGDAPAAGDVPADAGAGVVEVRGELDTAAGEALRAAVEQAVARSLPRLEVDLEGVTAFTEGGVAQLAGCHGLASGLAEGLHYRTAPGPGRDALLASYATGAAAG